VFGAIERLLPLVALVNSTVPELPEVETLRRSLEPILLNRRITRAIIHRRDILILPGDPPGGFSRSQSRFRPKHATPDHLLAGSRIVELRRRGKQLALIADDRRALVIHLGMTGQVLETPQDQPSHTHLSWILDNDTRILFRDPRRFGSARYIPDVRSLWPDLGPDALTVSAPDLTTTSRRSIKAFLLDQAVLAGVGNIYADESLFRAGISPRRRANRLTPTDRSRLAAAIRHILAKAISARGSTLRDYRDGQGRQGSAQLLHRVYGRGRLPCFTCGKPLAQAVIAQRTTVYCRNCQR
jgi:formamidopyrimidine-DNA glycosylase